MFGAVPLLPAFTATFEPALSLKVFAASDMDAVADDASRATRAAAGVFTTGRGGRSIK